jgi:putative membrane protein
MKKLLSPLWLLPVFCCAATTAAAETASPETWHAQSLAQAIANMLIFALLGIAVAVVGFKVFDKCTPGNLTKEIVENKNVAAAIVGGAVILGVCLIVAAAMIG